MRYLLTFVAVVMLLFLSVVPSELHALEFPELVQCGVEDPSHPEYARECGFSDMVATVGRITQLLIIIGISVSAIVFAYAGILYMTAAGSPEQISEAHKIFGKVLVGFILMLSAWLIVKFIQDQLIDPQFQNLEQFDGKVNGNQ